MRQKATGNRPWKCTELEVDVFTHVSDEGRPHMVDISAKAPTQRKATAQTKVYLPFSLKLDQGGEWWLPKGPVFNTAILAGIQGAKQTAQLIPLCHPLALSSCQVDIELIELPPGQPFPAVLQVRATVACFGSTGVEMEALCGVSVAALTIYDMAKSVSHDMVIGPTELLHKSGGKSGIYDPGSIERKST